MKIFKKKSLLLTLVTILILFSFSACKDKQSNLSSAEMKILNTAYDSLSQDQKEKIPTLVQDMNLHDWDKYGDKLKKLYEDESTSDLAKAGSTNTNADKETGDYSYEEDKKEAIANLKGKSTSDTTTSDNTSNSSMAQASATSADTKNNNKLKSDPSVQAVTSFFQAWKDKDFNSMYSCTQISWRNMNNNNADLLKNQYGIKDLKDFRVIEITESTATMNIVKVKVNYTFGNSTSEKYINANVINENDKWGVNPISTLKEEDI